MRKNTKKKLIIMTVYVFCILFFCVSCRKKEQIEKREEKTINETSVVLVQPEDTESSGPEDTVELTTQQQTTLIPMTTQESENIIEQQTQTVSIHTEQAETTTLWVEEITTIPYTVTDLNAVMYAVQDVNVRQGPSTQYERIGSLSINQEVMVTGKADTGWYRISYKNREGYVSGNYLVSEKKQQETSAVQTTTIQQEMESETVQQVIEETTSPKEEKKAQARVVAQEIADYILSVPELQMDIDKVYAAANIVSQYCANAIYTTDGENYAEAYGVFISGEFSCAGATRALGMILNCMGYEWEHVNENQWSHQWCRLNMDGQIGWADGQIGLADYGTHPVE